MDLAQDLFLALAVWAKAALIFGQFPFINAVRIRILLSRLAIWTLASDQKSERLMVKQKTSNNTMQMAFWETTKSM